MKKTIFKTTIFLLVIFWFGPIFSQNQLTGTVNYHDDPSFPMPEVTMHLLDMNNNLIQTTSTNDFGVYFFDGIPDGSYTLSPATSLDPGEVTLRDAFLIMMHLFGLYDFTEFEFAAADVNGSGTITWNDYFIVLISYLLQGQPFPVGDWQFQPVQLDFVSSRDLGTPDTANVWATGSGDLEGLWMPSGRSLALITGHEGGIHNLGHETVYIPLATTYNELMSGFSVNLKYPAELLTITDVQGPDGNLSYAISDGKICIVWMDESENAGTNFYGDQLCAIVVNRKAGVSESLVRSFLLEENAMILGVNGSPVEAKIYMPVVKSSAENLKTAEGVFPNPVRANMEIRFLSDDESCGELFIFNSAGQIVYAEKASAAQMSCNVLQVNVEHLKTGLYNYTIKSNNSTNIIVTGRFFKSE